MPKAIAIMQPYFMPYIGYWQLMNAVDQFVVYDNIQFTKKGWINRNRFLKNSEAEIFTLPLKKDSSLLNIRDRYLSDSFDKEASKICRRIEAAYKKAPNFNEAFSLFERCISYKDKNLFGFIYHSINQVKEYLGIDTELIISSEIDTDHNLFSDQRVKAICHALKAETYVNPIGGIDLYSKDDFLLCDINLRFHKSVLFEYRQFDDGFEPWLSILDLTMFKTSLEIRDMAYLESYHLV